MYPRRDSALDMPEGLEADVMARYRESYGHRSWMGLLNPKNRFARYAFGSLVIVALTGAACEVPTSTPVAMGQHVTVQLAPSGEAPGRVSLDFQIETVRPGAGVEPGAGEPAFEGNPIVGPELQAALAAAGAEKIEFRMRHVGGGLSVMDVLVWGQHLSRNDVERAIEQHVGKDRILTYDIRPLTGTVSETLGKRVGRRLFDLDIGRETAEELRAAILARLAEQGFDGEALVEVQDDGSVRKITVEAGTADGSRKIANEVILDQRDN